ncbi:hypothetical protein HII31_10798 [Pseudocercospora fuligena]|uniref:Retrovirus-related Pol polyprotein from transposon TNT 1-94-like beta-barrel domain-containing protein n=1 Tax=Pseudocercospora fuligena TaxID=685502 RepID=A0A8H6RBC3_9PEZI|nr:hypothetical protein HII31_10798 [Pseudocercospora fuligena]
MPPTGSAYNIDWIWSFESNVHIANHRDWFTSFTPITSEVNSDNGSSVVEGIGSVELEVRKLYGEAAKRNKGPKNSKITLRNVLYVPSFPCNVMGNPIREDYDVSIGAERWLMDKQKGTGLGLLDKTKAGTVKLMLKGQAKGDTGLPDDFPERTKAVWPDEEKKKWQASEQK